MCSFHIVLMWPYIPIVHSTFAIYKDDLGWHCWPNIWSRLGKCFPAYGQQSLHRPGVISELLPFSPCFAMEVLGDSSVLSSFWKR